MSQSRTFNVGLVGLGFMAVTHLKAYQKVPGVRVAALCNPSGRHLDGDFSSVFGNIGSNEPFRLPMEEVKTFTSFQQMLNDPEIDIIDICAPTLAHPELTIAALAAGKHVLCEKPLARTSAEALRIVENAANARGFFMPAMCLRFWPEYAWLKEQIAGEKFGKVLSATFRRAAEPPGWSQNVFLDGKKSGGALLDLHIHDVDFIAHCFGKPRSVFSSGYSKLSGAIDHVVTHYQFEPGSLITAEGTWALTPGFGFQANYMVNFERATADFDSSRGPDALKLFEQGQAPRKLELNQPDGYVGELTYFVDSIQKNRRPTLVTAVDGLISVQICEAEEESIRTNSVVKIK